MQLRHKGEYSTTGGERKNKDIPTSVILNIELVRRDCTLGEQMKCRYQYLVELFHDNCSADVRGFH